MLGGTGHIMFNDPCRNWHFSLTIEGNKARLWIHTRSHSAVTMSFDIQKNLKELVQFFLFIGYAFKEQLGYDPTIKRVLDQENNIQYRYEVGDVTGTVRLFQTVKILEQASAPRLHSRAMRVFHVRESDANGQLDRNWSDNVLRDFWSFADARSERSIQQEILDKLHDLPKEEYPDDLRDIKKHFMEFVCDLVVGRPVPAPPANSAIYEFPDRANPSAKRSARTQVQGF